MQLQNWMQINNGHKWALLLGHGVLIYMFTGPGYWASLVILGTRLNFEVELFAVGCPRLHGLEITWEAGKKESVLFWLGTELFSLSILWGKTADFLVRANNPSHVHVYSSGPPLPILRRKSCWDRGGNPLISFGSPDKN